MKRKLAVIATSVLAFLLSAAVALAAPPVVSVYGGEGGGVQGELEQGGEGGLPFTGLDLRILLAGAALLVAVGVILRKLARAR